MSVKPVLSGADQARSIGGPTYFDNEAIDHLIGIVLDLGAEMWVTKDRLAFMEELLQRQGLDLTAELDNGRPSAEQQKRLDDERRKMIRRIYGRLYSRFGGENSQNRTAPM